MKAVWGRESRREAPSSVPNHHLFKSDKGRVVQAVVTGVGAQSPQTFLAYTSQLYLLRHLKYKLCAMKNIGQNTHFQ